MHTKVCIQFYSYIDLKSFAFLKTMPLMTVLYCIVLYCIVLHCTVLCCTVLWSNVMYCIVLYYVEIGLVEMIYLSDHLSNLKIYIPCFTCQHSLTYFNKCSITCKLYRMFVIAFLLLDQRHSTYENSSRCIYVRLYKDRRFSSIIEKLMPLAGNDIFKRWMYACHLGLNL